MGKKNQKSEFFMSHLFKNLGKKTVMWCLSLPVPVLSLSPFVILYCYVDLKIINLLWAVGKGTKKGREYLDQPNQSRKELLENTAKGTEGTG